VGNLSSDDVEVYDVSDMVAVHYFTATTVFSNTTVMDSGSYTVTFGTVMGDSGRCLALTPAARLDPAGFEDASPLRSVYTPDDLLATEEGTPGADYIIISHGDFWSWAEVLAGHRVWDHRVALVDVQRIYDQFNGGLMSAEAIHDFLTYAYYNWEAPPPEFVVLLGDGPSDMRNYKGSSAPTYIPPYLALVDLDLGETAADNRYVTIAGDDVMPDMHLGRLPANSPEEAQAMIQKIIAYEGACACLDWNENLLFVTDDLEGGGGNFYYYSDEIVNGFVPDSYNVSKTYLGMTCDLTNPPLADECRSQIIDTLNMTGTLLVSFIGHATKENWAVEHLLDEVALNELSNGPCLPIMVPMTCSEGSFHEPQLGFTSLGEASVRMPYNGAVASWSPTGLGVASGHDLLERGLFQALFYEGVVELGRATSRGKQYLLDNQPQPGAYEDLVETYILLGDPGLKVQSPDLCVPTGARMVDLSAEAQGGGVLVSWQTASELDVLGFRVLRSSTPEGGFVPQHEALISATKSGSDLGAAYTYLDTEVVPGEVYYYRLEIALLDGEVEQYGLAEATASEAWRWSVYLPVVVR
jgi:hypothetical protein